MTTCYQSTIIDSAIYNKAIITLYKYKKIRKEYLTKQVLKHLKYFKN